jgi:hypothetical protein
MILFIRKKAHFAPFIVGLIERCYSQVFSTELSGLETVLTKGKISV